MLRAFVLILLIGLVQGQVVSTPEPSFTVGTPTLYAPDEFAATDFGVCLNGTANLVPCAADQWEFEVPSGSASTWLTFHFEFTNYTFPNTTAFISLYYRATQGYPAVGTPGDILDRAPVDLWNSSNTFDFAYEWTLHCSFKPGFYYMTVESLDKSRDYDSHYNDANDYGQERFGYYVELCLQSVPIITLDPFTPFCDVTDPDTSCFISDNGPFTTQNDVGFNNISAFEEASIHFQFTTPTQTQLGNQFLPGMRIRVHHREEDQGIGDFSLWVVSLRKDSFTSAYYVLADAADVCPWDQYSFPEVRGNYSYGAMQVDQIDIWVPRCEMELGTTYYLSVLPPFDHVHPDLIRNVTFWITIEIDQINPTEIATVNMDDPAIFHDSVDGFLLPLGYAHELLPGRRNEPPTSGPLLDTFIGNFYPLSLPFAPLDLWDDTDGPVDRYERSARWYAIDIPSWDSPSDFPTLEITLKGAQWGRRTDDGQWNQLGFNSAANPFADLIGSYTDYVGPLADNGARDLASATWLRPDDLSAGMQRFMGFDVDSMRQVDLMISTDGLPLGGLEWISSLSRYNQTQLNSYQFNTGPYQGAEGFMNFSGVAPEGHRGVRTPTPADCPQPQLSCRAYPDRYHRQHDDSTSSCRITLDYCQLQNYLGSATRIYIGVAPVKLIWANQDREGIASVGSAAPYEGTAEFGSIPSGAAIQGSKPARNVVSRVVSHPYSGNPESPSSGNWELLYTLQDMDLRFELDVSLSSNPVNDLGTVDSANSVVANGQAAVDSVDYYSFSVADEVSETDALDLEVFAAYSQQNLLVELYEGSELACGMKPIWSCSTSSADPLTTKRAGSCHYHISGCELVAGSSYIVAVSSPSDDDLVNDETLSYTLKATASALLADSQWERPLNQAVRVGAYNHYSFQVEDNNQTVALRLRISDVQNGKVSAYLRYEGPAGEDSCLLWDYTCSPGGGYHECDLVAPYCVDGAGTYYVSVYGEESSWSAASRTSPSNGLIAYVLTPYLHHAEWVDWVPSPDANDPTSAVTITRSIPAEVSSQGIIKFADDIVKPDVRYFFWNDDQSRLNPSVPGVQQPVVPFAGFRPFGAYSFGEFGASPGAVLGAEAHYYYFEFTPSLVNFSNGLATLVTSITINQHQSGVATDDSVTLYVSPYAIANDLCNCWSCVAQPGEDSYSTCKIVLQECDLLPVLDTTTGERSAGSDADPEIWYLTVRYDQYDTQAKLPVDYTLQLQMKGQEDVQLEDGQAVYATVAANEYNHYVFTAPNDADTAINVELYINRDLINNVEFFMGVGQRAGAACPEWSSVEPECETASYQEGREAPLFTTCTIKIHPCDVIPGEEYWFSVYGSPAEGSSFFAGSSAEYTLRVWSEAAVDLDTDGWPVTGSVTGINHYRITVSPDFFSPTYKHLFVQLDAVNGGTVRSWLNKGAIGAACQDSNSCAGQRRPFEGEFELEIDNCQLQSGDEYFLSVAATSFEDADVPVRYTVRAYTKEVEILTVLSADWGRNESAIEVSLERLESVVLVINPQPLITAAANAETGAASLAIRAGASVHVHIHDVTWGTFQYWVNTLPTGETAPGSYPYGVASPECHSQTGGVTGNTRSHSPDNQYEYDSPGNPTLSGTDSQYTFQRVPPDELYLRFACDVQNVQTIYLTLVATVVPEWQRLPCDRTLNASIDVWLEVPTILEAPPDTFTFSDDSVTSSLNWATAPEPLTVWGRYGEWANWTPKPAPSFDLIWSLTFADEYKMFAYPVDFSVTDSIGIYITASDFAFPNSLTSGFQGLGFPSGVSGTDYEAYYLFVSESDLAAAATGGNTAVPGEQTNYCGFSLPAHFDWDSTSESVLVLTSCMYDYQPGVVFLALRYPAFVRTEYPEINPAVAVAWDFPNSYTSNSLYEFDLASGSQNISTAYLQTHSAPFYTSYIDYELGLLETAEVDITFPETWDTLFPLWAYYVEIIPLGVGLEASPIWTYTYTPGYNTSSLYPLILEVSDSGVTFDPANRDYACQGLELSNFTDATTATYRIGGGQTCCRIAELSQSRTLRILAANNRVPDLLRGYQPTEFDSPRNNATFRVQLTVFPYHINSTQLVVLPQPLTLGVTYYPEIYSVYSYSLSTASFGPNDVLRVQLWYNNSDDTLGSLELHLSENSLQYSVPPNFAVDRLESNCFAGGSTLCTITAADFEGPVNPAAGQTGSACYKDYKACDLVKPGVDTLYFTLVLPLTWSEIQSESLPYQAGFLVELLSPEPPQALFQAEGYNVSNFNGAIKVVEIPFSNFDLSPFEALWSRRSYSSNSSLVIGLFNFSDIFGDVLDCGEVATAFDHTLYIDSICDATAYTCDVSTSYSYGNFGGQCALECRVPICDLDWVTQETIFYVVAEALTDDGQVSFQVEAFVDPRNQTGFPLLNGVWEELVSNASDVYEAFYFDYAPPANPPSNFELSYLEFGVKGDFGYWSNSTLVVLNVWPETLCEGEPQVYACSAVPDPWDVEGPARCYIPIDACNFDRETPLRWYGNVHVYLDNSTQTDLLLHASSPLRGSFNYSVVAQVKYPPLVSASTVLTAGSSFDSEWVEFDRTIDGSQQHHYRFDLPDLASAGSSLSICLNVDCAGKPTISPYRWELVESEGTGSWVPPTINYPQVEQTTDYDGPNAFSENYAAHAFVAATEAPTVILNSEYADNRVFVFQSEFNPSWKREKLLEHLVSVQKGDQGSPLRLIPSTLYIVVTSSPDNNPTDTPEVLHLADPAVDFNINALYYNWENHWATNDCHEFHADLSDPGYAWSYTTSTVCYELSQCELQSGYVYVSVGARDNFYAYNQSGLDFSTSYQLSVVTTARDPVASIELNQWYTLDADQQSAVDCSSGSRSEVAVYLTGIEWGAQVSFQVRSEEVLTDLLRVCPRWGYSNSATLGDPANVLDRTTPHLVDSDNLPCDDYSQCTILSDRAFDGSSYIYASSLLDPCSIENGWLYLSVAGLPGTDVDIRLTLDYKTIPTYVLSEASISGSPVVTVAGQTIPNQWQFYKFNIDNSVPRSAQWRFTVSLSEISGGESVRVTMTRGNAGLPAVPSGGCEQNAINCQSGSEETCLLADSWCESADTESYWIGVLPQSTVNAVVSFQLEASILQATFASITSCEPVCVAVAEGETLFIEFSSENDLLESLNLFDVRDLQGSVEIAVEQGHLPGWPSECHAGSTWLIDSSDLVWQGGDQRTTITADYFNYFNRFITPYYDLDYDLEQLGQDIWVNNATFDNTTIPDPNLADLLANPDARSFAQERAIAEYSAFRFALPCLGSSGSIYFAIYGHEDSTFTFTVRSESLITDANTLVGESDSYSWKSSPLDGFVATHLAPQAASLLNDYAACDIALTATGQWPHLYKWDYSEAFAAERRPYGWELNFYKGAEKFYNDGILVVNENALAAPILAASSSQWPPIPGLNPMALPLANLNDCSNEDINTLTPQDYWWNLEYCDLTPKTLYFFVLFDYQLRRDYFNLPLTAWNGNPVDELGHTSTTTAFTGTGGTTASTSSIIFPPTTTTATTASTSSTATLLPTATAFTGTDNPNFYYSPERWYPFEYKLNVFTLSPPLSVTVGAAPITINMCDYPPEQYGFYSFNQPIRVVIEASETAPPTGGRLIARLRPLYGNNWLLRYYAGDQPQTCAQIDELGFIPNDLCSSIAIDWVPEVDQFLWVHNVDDQSCECATALLDAYWEDLELPWLVPQTLDSAVTGGSTGPVQVTDVQSIYLVGSSAMGQVFSLPTDTAAPDFVHVRVAGVIGGNVRAVVTYPDLFTVVGSCNAQYNQVPFYSNIFNASVSPSYAHGLHGECDIYLSPEVVSAFTFDANAPSIFIGVVRDDNIEVLSTGTDRIQYYLEVTTSYTPLTNTAETYQMSGYDADFFVSEAAGGSSISWTIVHESGPAVRIYVSDSIVPDANTLSLEPVWCFATTCTIQLATAAQISPSSDAYYLIVDREYNHWQKDTVYSISHAIGADNAVNDYLSTVGSLPFCSIIQSVNFTINVVDTNTSYVWNYSPVTLDAKDAEAESRYIGVASYFQGPLSDDCLSALGIWSCLDIIRETDDNGVLLPPCRQQCDDVVSACGAFTLAAALPEFDCGSSRYYQGSEVGQCTGSIVRHVRPPPPPEVFYVNASVPAVTLRTLTTTSGTTTTTTSSTSSTTTTGTDGRTSPFIIPPTGNASPASSLTFSVFLASFLALFIFW